MKIYIYLFLVLAAIGCTEPGPYVVEVLEVEPVIDYYSLGGYTGEAGEEFFAVSGDAGDVRMILNDVVIGGGTADTVFKENEVLNLVVFRGVFSTGGRGIAIDRVKIGGGNAFAVYATYADPGPGMMVSQAFTQPAAVVPIGELEKGSYEAILFVTTIQKDEAGDSIIGENVEHARVSFVVE